MSTDNLPQSRRAYILIVALIVCVYAPSVLYEFVEFDDVSLVRHQLPFLTNLANIPNAFIEDVFRSSSDSYYRPMLTLSLMADAQIAGPRPAWYHLSNVVLHAGAACLVLLLLVRLEVPRSAAVVGTAFFAVHPVLTMAVAWIPGRNDSLLTIFIVASILFLIRYIRGGTRTDLILHGVFWTGALLTKEVAVAALAIYTLLAWPHRKRCWPLAGTWAIGATLWLTLRAIAFKNPITLTAAEFGADARMAMASALQLMGKSLVPLRLSVLPDPRDAAWVPALLTIAIVTVLLISARRPNWSRIRLGLIWYVAFLVPSFLSLLIRTRENVPFVLEHRLYLPLVGLVLVLAETPLFNRERRSTETSRLLNATPWVLIGLLAVQTFCYARTFRDADRFWESAMRSSPRHPLAHLNTGYLHFEAGRTAAAERSYRTALALNPEQLLVNNNLGVLYLRDESFVPAAEHFLREIELNPTFPEPYFSLGNINYRAGNEAEAIRLWERTLTLQDRHRGALHNLAQVYHRRGTQARQKQYVDRMRKHGYRIPENLKRSNRR